MSNQYWAAASTKEIASEIESQFATYQQELEKTGYLARIRTSYNTYYGVNREGTFQLDQSDDGAITKMSVNHFKNLLKRLHILITQNKLAFVPRARNTDAKSQIEVDLAKGILEYYSDEKKMSGTFSEAVEMALVCFEAFVHSPWDEMAGDELAVDMTSKEVLYKGDQAFEVLSALDVARSMSTRKTDWHIIRVKKNKFDLAAQHPQFQDVILSSSTKHEYNIINPNEQIESENSDLTDVYILYHSKTPSMRKGREVWVVGSEVIKDRPLLYKKTPISRLSPSDVIGESFGDSPAVELLPIQQMLDALFSAVGTNNLNFAVQNIHSTDPNVKISKLNEGMNLIHSAQAPTPLQLTNSSAETYQLIESLINQEQLLSGVNSTARGNPESNLKSGNSMALMLSQAVQYVLVLQQNYAQLASDVGSVVINNLQQFGSDEMNAVIGGVSKQSYVKSFKSQDIINIDRVSVDLGNPISQTSAGRFELMQMMMQNGVLKSPDAIINFLHTGETDSSTEDKFKDSITIREENEALKRGEMPTAVLTDNHPQHIAEHKTVFADPVMRNDPVLMKNALAHMQEHGVLWQDLFQLHPEMAMALQIPPPPQVAPPMGPEGPLPPEGGSGPAPEDPEHAQINGTNLPSLPPNAPPESQQVYDQVEQSVKANMPPMAT